MGRLSTIRTQEDPDGLKGHEEREMYQWKTKHERPKRKFVGAGADKHCFTKPPIQILSHRQKLALGILDMKICDDYTVSCNPDMCALCDIRMSRLESLLFRAKQLIYEYETGGTR